MSQIKIIFFTAHGKGLRVVIQILRTLACEVIEVAHLADLAHLNEHNDINIIAIDARFYRENPIVRRFIANAPKTNTRFLGIGRDGDRISPKKEGHNTLDGWITLPADIHSSIDEILLHLQLPGEAA